MIKAVIFDMDGLLIDSEPLWREAEVRTFASVGIPLMEDDCLETMGMRVDTVIRHWYDRHPWEGATLHDVEQRLWDEIVALVREKGKHRPGVASILDFLEQQSIPMAIASSSSMRLIDVVVDTLKIRPYFQELYSAESEEHGKPHPGVYISTAQRMGVAAEDCLALEDSINGLISAKAARMKCVSVPDEAFVGDKRLSLADAVLRSLEDFDETLWKQLNEDV